MKIFKDQAIVIRKRKFQDSHEIIIFFTRNNGKMSVMAKGLRKEKKPICFDGYMDVFSKMNIHTYHRNNGSLGNLIDCDLADAYLGIRSEYSRLLVAWVIIEVLEKGFPEGLESPEAFDMGVWALEAVDQGMTEHLLCRFLIKILELLGQSPKESDLLGGIIKPAEVRAFIRKLETRVLEPGEDRHISFADATQLQDHLVLNFQSYINGVLRAYPVLRKNHALEMSQAETMPRSLLGYNR